MEKSRHPVRSINEGRCFKKILSLHRNRLTSRYFFLYYSSADYPEVGLQIGKRFLKKATNRNKVKRLIREYLRIHQETLPTMKFIIGVRKNIDEVELAELKICFYHLIGKFIELCK